MKPTEHLRDIALTGGWNDIKSETSGILEVHWEQAENNVLEIFLYGNRMADDSTVYMKVEFQSMWKPPKHEGHWQQAINYENKDHQQRSLSLMVNSVNTDLILRSGTHELVNYKIFINWKKQS